jgi:hypothetical protein
MRLVETLGVTNWTIGDISQILLIICSPDGELSTLVDGVKFLYQTGMLLPFFHVVQGFQIILARHVFLIIGLQ